MNELCFLVEHQNPKYDIIALKEVKPINRCSEIDLVEANIPGYNMVLSNIAEPDGRGIIVYIKVKKGVIFKCYSSEKLIALNTLHEVVPTWYSFYI